jgi:hypothetical protein
MNSTEVSSLAAHNTTDKNMFTRHELQKLHRNMFHPTNQALIELMKRAKLEELDEDGMKILQEISASCKTCQFMGPKPLLSEYPTSNRCDEHDVRINFILENCTVAGVPRFGG